jgi:hypothetical protein
MPLAEGNKASICHLVCASVLAATIGGASMGSYAALGATEFPRVWKGRHQVGD